MMILPTFFAAFVLQLFLPWWIIGPVAFALAFWLAENSKQAFRGAFTGIFLLWMTFSLWQSLPNENILANRVAEMFMLPDWQFSWLILVIITSAVGGLSAGLAGLSGFWMRSAFRKRKN